MKRYQENINSGVDPIEVYNSTLGKARESAQAQAQALKEGTMTAEVYEKQQMALIEKNAQMAQSSTATATAVKVLNTALNMAVVAVASFAINEIVKFLDSFTHSTERTKKNAQELADQYDSLKGELTSLEGELESTQERMEELRSLGSLTFVEQDEYNRLAETNAELEKQIKLKKAAADAAETNAGKAAYDAGAAKKQVGASGWLNLVLPGLPGFIDQTAALAGKLGLGDYGKTSEEAASDHIDAIRDLIRQREELNKSYDAGNTAERKYIDGLNDINEKIDRQKSATAPYIEELDVYASSLTDNTEEQRDMKARIKAIIEEYGSVIDSSVPNIQESFNRVLDTGKFDQVSEKLKGLADDGKLTSASLSGEEFSEFTGELDQFGLTIDQVVEHFNALAEAEKLAAGDTGAFFTAFESLQSQYRAGAISSEEYVSSLREQLDQVNGLISQNPQLAESFSAIADAIQSEISTAPSTLNTLTESTNALISSASSLSSAFAEQNENGQLFASTILQMVDAGYAAALSVNAETGAVTLNKDAFISLTKARIDDQIAQLELSKVDLVTKMKREEETARQLALANYDLSISYAARASETGGSVKDIEAEIAALTQMKNSVGNIAAGSYGSSGPSAADRMAAEFQKAYSQIQYLRDRGVISEQEYLDRLFELNERYNRDNAETWQKYDLELFNGRQKLLEQQLKAQGQAYSDAIDKQVEKLQEQKKAEQEHYDALIQAQQEKLAGLEEEWQAQDALLELERKKIALENAKKQRTALVYRKDQGFVWEADPEAVESAQDDLAQAQQDFERDQTKKEINDHIKALQQEKKETEENLDHDIEKWTELKDSIQENMSHIGETLTGHQEQMTLLAEAEAMSFDQMAAAAQNYANSVEDALQRVLDAKAQFAGKESSDRVISTPSSYQKNSGSNIGSSAVDKAVKAANELRRSQLNSEIYSLTQQIAMLERQYNAMKLGSPAAAAVVMEKIETLRSNMSKARSELNGIPKYVAGTRNARGGLAIVNESGQETILPKLRSGNYAVLGAGDIVLNAEQTKRFQDLLGAPHGFAAENITKSIQSMTTRIPNVGIPATRTVEEYTFNISKLEFPGVGTAEEIKRALMTLPNRAKQTMYRRK